MGRDPNDGDDELAGAHGQGTPYEERSSSEFLNGVEGEGRAGDVYDRSNHAHQKGVGYSDLREEGDVLWALSVLPM